MKFTNKLYYIIKEDYNTIGIDKVKQLPKLNTYNNFTNEIIINNHTYLNFIINDPTTEIEGTIKVFDNNDGTEIANAYYVKENPKDKLKSTIDVRPDMRRKGIASNIYQWIENLTKETLYPDTPHSEDANKLWNNPNRKFGPK